MFINVPCKCAVVFSTVPCSTQRHDNSEVGFLSYPDHILGMVQHVRLTCIHCNYGDDPQHSVNLVIVWAPC